MYLQEWKRVLYLCQIWQEEVCDQHQQQWRGNPVRPEAGHPDARLPNPATNPRGGDGSNERHAGYGKGNSRFGFWNTGSWCTESLVNVAVVLCILVFSKNDFYYEMFWKISPPKTNSSLMNKKVQGYSSNSSQVHY